MMTGKIETAVRQAILGEAGPASDVLIAAVAEALSNVLAEYPRLPREWLVGPRICGLEVARRLGFEPLEGSIDGRLHDEARRVAARHFQQMVSLGLLQAPQPARHQAWEPSNDVLSAINSQFELSKTQFLGALGGGRSGSNVVALFANAGRGGDEVLVAKVTDDVDCYTRELQGHRAAVKSWLSPWAAEEPRAGEVAVPPHSYHVLLSRLAFSPNRSQLYPESLHSLIAGGRVARAGVIVDQLGDGYGALVASGQGADTQVMAGAEFLAGLKKQWSGLSAAWGTEQFWHWSGLPGPSQPSFLDGDIVKCNPLWYICQASAASDARYPFWFSFQHGDLNCRNILIDGGQPQSDEAGLRLIDFEKSGTTAATLDLCWLALWILESAVSGLEPGCDEWELAPEQFASIVLQQPHDDKHLRSFHLGLDLVRRLVASLWKRVQDAGAEGRGLLENRLQRQLALTLAACASAMCAYEIRKHRRLVEDGWDEESDDQCRRALLWAWLYLRIGASVVGQVAIPDRPATPMQNVATMVRSLSKSR